MHVCIVYRSQLDDILLLLLNNPTCTTHRLHLKSSLLHINYICLRVLNPYAECLPQGKTYCKSRKFQMAVFSLTKFNFDITKQNLLLTKSHLYLYEDELPSDQQSRKCVCYHISLMIVWNFLF